MRLTDLSIRQLPVPESGQKTYFEGDGFGVRVSQGGTKTFVQMFGKDRRLTSLGRYPAVSLRDARKTAKGVQVAPAPKRGSCGTTEAVEIFLTACQERCRPNTISNYRLYLKRLPEKLLSELSRTDVERSPHAIMAAKVFMNWAMREEMVDRNPFAMERVKYNQRSRVLTDDEIKAVWGYEHAPFSDHLKLLILTGQRRNQFTDFEVRGDTLFFPARSMKGKEDHTIPLLSMAQTIIERLDQFNSWSKQKVRIDRHVPLPHWTPHDLRRTFSTVMARLRIPLHVTEKILAHRSGTVSGVAASYNRHDFMEEAREALAKYEQHIHTLTA